jgi:hypothetical protein
LAAGHSAVACPFLRALVPFVCFFNKNFRLAPELGNLVPRCPISISCSFTFPLISYLTCPSPLLQSSVLHEADIAVLTRSEAKICRYNRVAPRTSSLVLTEECKFYTTSLGLGLARGFVGLCTEFGSEHCFFPPAKKEMRLIGLSRLVQSFEKIIVDI